MPKWNQGIFTPKNPSKYIGNNIRNITYRSSWELTLMNVCDNHPNIQQWASEPIQIPYVNPIKGKRTIYIPDFLIIYVDARGNKKAEIIEIKPSKEVELTEKSSKKDKASIAVNHAKWEAARVWANKHGLSFRIMTEFDLYIQAQNPPKKNNNAKKKKKK